ncbi:MAG: tryptophan synthase subunit alpha [Acidobacteria bacterium]|nr:tryptophan synthase subunit alpha [Acidobacteriota bacterium]
MPSSERIAERFAACKAAGRPALVAYITAGDPTPGATEELALAMERGGADVLELGAPFSDPIADGPVIQRASDRALKAGTTVARVLDIASSIRKRSDIPIVLFSYLNPLLRYGFDRLCSDARQAGVDGCLLTDLSVEEAGDMTETLRRHGLDTVFLAAPTSTERRLALVAQHSTGFVYVVSRSGVTGEQDSVSGGVEELIANLRRHTALPLAVGFGISRREHVEAVGRYADGVIVGSAFMRLIERYCGSPDLAARLEAFTRELSAKS